MIRRVVVLFVIVCFVLVGLAISAWADERGAKGIFYSGEGPTVMAGSQEQGPAAKQQSEAPTTKPKGRVGERKREPYMGISYWIELTGKDGKKQRVTADRSFRSGDRIKLLLVANRDGYLYLLNIGSTGRSYMLFPHSGMAPGDNLIKANTHYEIPYSATIRFDENPGEETLLVFLSPQPMSELLPGGDPQAPTFNAEQTAKWAAAGEQGGAKDLVLETDNAGPRAASYAVAPLSSLGNGGMITLKINLKHK